MKSQSAICRVLALGFLLAALASPAAGQELMFRHVTDAKSNTFVEVNSMFGKLPATGFAPVRVTIANRTKRDRTISLGFRSSDGFYGRGGSEMRSHFKLTAAAGRTELIDLLVPLTTALSSTHGGQMSLRVTMGGDMGSSTGGVTTEISSDMPAVLLSEALYTINGSALDAETGTHFSSRWSGLGFAGQFTPNMTPDDWRAYAGFDVMMLTDGDWTSLPAGARGAILAWIRLGGRLVVFSTTQSATLASLGIGDEKKRSFGRVEMRRIDPKLNLKPKETVALAVPGKSGAFRTRLDTIYHDTASGWPLQDYFGTKAFNYILFILVLVVFGVIVGPINLFVFARSGRRHRLFVTTPLISLGASALLVALILIQDGFGGRGYRLALVEVRADGDEHAAYVHQEQISRTGVMLGGSFDLGEASLISPVPLAATRWTRVTQSNGGGGARYNIQPASDGGTASGDWLQSRSEQGQVLCSVIPTRGRIEQLPQAGPPQVMSFFEFPIQKLYLTAADGSIWTVEDLQPGRTATCSEAGETEYTDFLGTQYDRFTLENRNRLKRVARRKAHFIAIANQGPLPLVETSDAINWKSSEVVLTGPLVGRRAGAATEGPSEKGQGPN